MMNFRYECRSCHHDFDEEELDSKCVFPGNLIEPPEYEWCCPVCDNTGPLEEPTIWKRIEPSEDDDLHDTLVAIARSPLLKP